MGQYLLSREAVYRLRFPDIGRLETQPRKTLLK